VAEESVADGKGEEVLTKAPTWLIDPIDGTTNFVHKFPNSAISVALAIDEKVVLGIVYNPILEQLYTAMRGKGSYCNGKRLQVSKTDILNHCLVGTGFPYDRSITDKVIKILKIVLLNVRDIRRAGAAALDMCYVAQGIFDAYYEFDVHAWDIAAGTLILEEAGGLVDYIEPKDHPGFDLCARQVLATNQNIHQTFKNLIRSQSKL